MYKSLKISKKEAAKITHDINNVWHMKYKGKKYCTIETHSQENNTPSYVYHFINLEFNNYLFVGKYPTPDRRENR